MNTLTPELERQIQELFEEQTDELRKENATLRQKLEIMSDGSQISKSDYQEVLKRLREEEDNNLDLRHQVSDLQYKLSAENTKFRKIKQQLDEQNERQTMDDNSLKKNGEVITSLKKEVQSLEKDKSELKTKLLSMIQEKEQMANTITEYSETNKDLVEAIKQLNEQSENVVKHNMGIVDQLSKKDDEIDSLKAKIALLKQNIEATSKEVSETEISTLEMGHESFISNEMKEKLISLQKENKKLKNQLESTKDEVKELDVTQKALITCRKQIESYKDLIDKSEKEVIEYKTTAAQFNVELSNANKKLSTTEEICDMKIKSMKEEMEAYKEKSETYMNRVISLEKQANEMSEELNEERRIAYKIKNSEFGLYEAITKIKEQDAMVKLRDKQISELVREVNTMDITISALTSHLGSDFDMEKFINETEDKLFGEDEKRMRFAYSALRKRLKILKNKVQLKDINIYLEKKTDQETRKKVVVDLNRNSDEYSEFNSEISEEEEIEKESDDSISDDSLSDNGTKSLDSTFGSSIQSSTESLTSLRTHKVVYEDAQIQCNVYLNEHVSEPSDISSDTENDKIKENLSELRQKYRRVQSLNDSLREQNEQNETLITKLRNESLQLKDDLKEEKEMLFAAQTDLGKRKTERDEIKKMHDELLEEKANIKLEVSKKMLVHEKIEELPKLITNEFCAADIELKVVEMKMKKSQGLTIEPSEEEIRKKNEEREEHNKKVQGLMMEISTMQRIVSDSKLKLDQKQKTIDDKEKVITSLEERMADERNKYKDRLRQLQEESKRTLEKQLEDTITHNRIGSALSNSGDYTKIPEVSEYINALKEENTNLKEKVSELEDITTAIKKEVERLRSKNKRLEAEIEEQDSKPQREVNTQANMEYMKKLQRKNVDLKKKVDYLSDENRKLKAIRERHEDDATQEAEKDFADTIDKLTTRNSALQQRYSKLKVSTEELQQQLIKEKEKVEKLKSSLQKKEDTVQILTEKYQRYKHQNEKLKAKIKSSR